MAEQEPQQENGGPTLPASVASSKGLSRTVLPQIDNETRNSLNLESKTIDWKVAFMKASGAIEVRDKEVSIAIVDSDGQMKSECGRPEKLNGCASPAKQSIAISTVQLVRTHLQQARTSAFEAALAKAAPPVGVSLLSESEAPLALAALARHEKIHLRFEGEFAAQRAENDFLTAQRKSRPVSDEEILKNILVMYSPRDYGQAVYEMAKGNTATIAEWSPGGEKLVAFVLGAGKSLRESFFMDSALTPSERSRLGEAALKRLPASFLRKQPYRPKQDADGEYREPITELYKGLLDGAWKEEIRKFASEKRVTIGESLWLFLSAENKSQGLPTALKSLRSRFTDSQITMLDRELTIRFSKAIDTFTKTLEELFP